MSSDPNNEVKTEINSDEPLNKDSNPEGTASEEAAALVEAADDSGTAQDVDNEQTVDPALAEALEKITTLQDQMLREKAETQNIRKRVQRDVENARKYALEKFVGELLPVIDNLERALDAPESADAVKEGIQLTLKSFIDVLAKFKVEQINPVGEPFDANFHQAITMLPNPDMEPNTVMDVMQKGYTLNERLVRPAMVVVSKTA